MSVKIYIYVIFHYLDKIIYQFLVNGHLDRLQFSLLLLIMVVIILKHTSLYIAQFSL